MDLPGENEAEYLIAAGDVTNRLRLVVTARNAEGSAVRTSVVSAVVSSNPGGYPGDNQALPASLEALAPAALSSPLVGDTLRIADGPGSPPLSDGWFNPKATTYAYAWRRCAADGELGTCETIAGATERSYKPTDADAGHSLRARLTGTNGSGSKALLTSASGPVGFPDRDGDGFTSDRDCNDGDPAIRPTAADAPGNGVDENCSGADAAIARDEKPPILDSLALTPSAFRAARGAKVSYRLSEAATVTFTVERPVSGVRKGRRCVKPQGQGPSKAKGKHCTRYVSKGHFAHKSALGANSLRFSGRVRGKLLSPGPYRLSAEALDAAGNRSAKPATESFRVLPAGRP